MNGKGDTYRPVNQDVYAENYDRIFQKGKYAPAPENSNPAVVRDDCHTRPRSFSTFGACDCTRRQATGPTCPGR
jgi:hypothetical protein